MYIQHNFYFFLYKKVVVDNRTEENMIKKIFGLFALAFMFIQGMAAQVYVLDAPDEQNFSTVSSTEYDLDGRPAGALTFEAKCVSILGFWGGDLHVDQYVNGTWSKLTSVSFAAKDTYYTFGPFDLDRKATKIKLYTQTGAIGKKYMQNVKVTMASYVETEPAVLTMPDTELGTATTSSFTVSYSNVAQLNVSSNNNTLFTPNITTITESGTGKYGAATVTITYKPVQEGTQQATITIGNGMQQATVQVQGTAVKKQQQIVWKENLDVLSQGVTVENAATATSGLSVTLASDNEAIIAVEDGKLVAKSAGTASIMATQTGNEQWAAVTDTKEITVTTLEVQTITWEQNLLLLKLGDAPLALNAMASSGLAVTYRSSDDNVVSVSGNMLTIIGTGTATVTATQAGNGTYAPVSMAKAVRVREVSAGCDEVALVDASSYNLGSAGSKTFDLPRPGASLSFNMYLPGSVVGTLTVTENLVDGTSNTILYEESLYSLSSAFAGKTVPFTGIAVSHKAVSITFAVTGTLTKTISDILVTQATYLETDKSSISSEVGVGSVYNETLTVNYSNLPDMIMVSHTNKDFTLSSGEYFGEGCGDFGNYAIGISYQSYNMGEVSDTIVLTCASQTVRVPLTLNVRKQTQAIQWEQSLADVSIQDTIALTATSSAGLDIIYTSNNPAVAVILDGNKLAFAGAGEAEITASQTGNDYFEAAQPMTKTVSVSRIVPSISALPAANDLTYGQTLSESELSGGEASVPGTFVWEDGSVIPNAGAEQRFAVMFIPEKLELYETLTDSVMVNVAKAVQTITWEQDLMLMNAGDTVVLTAFASSSLPVSYTSESTCVSIKNDTLVAVFAGNGTITAIQAGDENYLSAEPVVLNFSILPRDVAIVSVPVASDITYGQALSKSALTGGAATIPGTFQWANPSFKPDAGQHRYEVNFVPDNAEEETILLMVSVMVHKATQTLLWEQDIFEIMVGDTIELLAEASSGLPVTYQVGDTALLAVKDSKLIALKSGKTDILALQEGNENYEAADGVRLYVTISEELTQLSVTNVCISMQVFPNPATDVLHIRIDEPLREIRLYDIGGRLIMAEQPGGVQEVVLPVSLLPRGIYQLYVRTDENIAVQRIICR